MLRFGIAACAAAALVLAEGFTFTVGSPVASQDYQAKGAAFVFRTQGCAEPVRSQISGTAEGLVKGERRSMILKVVAMTRPGVYAVYQNWPAEGAWVVNLTGKYLGATTSAIVPIGPKGFMRESSKFLNRSAGEEDVQASLKALSEGTGNAVSR